MKKQISIKILSALLIFFALLIPTISRAQQDTCNIYGCYPFYNPEQKQIYGKLQQIKDILKNGITTTGGGTRQSTQDSIKKALYAGSKSVGKWDSIASPNISATANNTANTANNVYNLINKVASPTTGQTYLATTDGKGVAKWDSIIFANIFRADTATIIFRKMNSYLWYGGKGAANWLQGISTDVTSSLTQLQNINTKLAATLTVTPASASTFTVTDIYANSAGTVTITAGAYWCYLTNTGSNDASVNGVTISSGKTRSFPPAGEHKYGQITYDALTSKIEGGYAK
jgi:hypothetical protein